MENVIIAIALILELVLPAYILETLAGKYEEKENEQKSGESA